MTDSEKQIEHFVQNLETFTLGRWMVNMQNIASRLPSNSRAYLNLCVSMAAGELKLRYSKNRLDS